MSMRSEIKGHTFLIKRFFLFIATANGTLVVRGIFSIPLRFHVWGDMYRSWRASFLARRESIFLELLDQPKEMDYSRFRSAEVCLLRWEKVDPFFWCVVLPSSYTSADVPSAAAYNTKILPAKPEGQDA